jgi:hypothetical protein
MAFYVPAVADQVRVTWFHQNGNQLGLCHMDYVITAIGGVGLDLGEIGTAADSFYRPLVVPLMGPNTSYRGNVVSTLPPLATWAPATTADALVGSAGDLALPSQVSLLISKKTAKGGRKFRGRMYIPFPGRDLEDMSAPGQLTGPAATNLTNLALALEATYTRTVGINSVTFAPIVYHKVTLNNDRVTICVPSITFATQRKRGSYGRTNTIPF